MCFVFIGCFWPQVYCFPALIRLWEKSAEPGENELPRCLLRMEVLGKKKAHKHKLFGFG